VTDTGTEGVTLRLLVVKTRHLDKARAFYQALGIHLAEERHGNGPVHYAGQAGGRSSRCTRGPKRSRPPAG
jgi:catechol 2,3-dioxygenase-like lactoylglutathione lyase family enzyme